MHYKGFDFFMHRSVAETGGQIMLYWDKPPYPFIKLIMHEKNQLDEITVQRWIDDNLDKLIDVLQRINEFIQIPKDIMKKMNTEAKYKILEEHDGSVGLKLVCAPIGNDEYLYLWCDPSEAPTKTVKGKPKLDIQKIYSEYLRRKENDR